VVITPREIYDAVSRVSGQVDRLSGSIVTFEQGHGDHETRLRVLEEAWRSRPRWPLASVMALASMAAAIAALIALLTR
jgi:hypothetical protein